MDLVTVAECGNEFDAALLRNFLEGNGIRTYMAGGRLSTRLTAMTFGVPTGAALQVAESDVERVTELLKEKSTDRPEASVERSWHEKIARIMCWSVLAIPLVILSVYLVSWLFGWNWQ